MQVLLEVIPSDKARMKVDYEAFTIRNNWNAKDVFEAEYRKLIHAPNIEKLESFLDGPIVRRHLRTAFDRDIRFAPLELHLELGNDSCTYRLSPYVAGKHSR